MAETLVKPAFQGAFGHFYRPDEALAAARRVRDAKFTFFDVLTPFPVHGMDEAMGMKRSWIPWVTAVFAFVGIMTAQTMMVGIMTFLWPMNYGGKPPLAWPSFVPISFELMVLFAGISSAVFAVFFGKREGKRKSPPADIRTGATGDRFVVWISAEDPRFNPSDTVSFLKEINADGVRLIDGEGRDATI